MTTAPKLKWRELRIDQIDVPREYRRSTPNKDADMALASSVKLSGVHQPLAVIPNGARFLLVKGTRRLNAAELNGIGKVPVIVNFPPAGLNAKELKSYRDRLRFILDSKRQDLTPSQEVKVIEEAQRTFKMNNKEIAALLGMDPASITNRKRILHYAKPIVAAIDRGELTLHHAMAFEGMRPAAQVKVFGELKPDIEGLSGRKMQAIVRKRYSPTKHPDMFLTPEKTAARVSKRDRKQLIKPRRVPVSQSELDRLNDDLESLETERVNNEELIKRADVLLLRIAPVHRAVSNDDALMDYVAAKYPEHIPALERFSELV